MASSPTHAPKDVDLPRREEPEDDDEDDEEDEDEPGRADDELADDPDADSDDAALDDEEEPAAPPRRSRVRAREGGSARGNGGMGRPSTAPKGRAPAARQVVPAVVSAAAPPLDDDPATEVAPDISNWPGTAEAAKIAGRHSSTIKLWRAQGRIRALQDVSGCWRHHPDDLAESADSPDTTDPGSVLASGMAAIVVQGGQASERLIEMTRTTTDGLKETADVLRKELERAYKRIAELEEKLNALRDKHAATHKEDLEHERKTLRMRQKHELDLVGGKETSERISGLLTVLGPIAASIGARLFGNLTQAEHIEATMTGRPSGTSPPGGSPSNAPTHVPTGCPPPTSDPAAVATAPTESSLVPVTPIETRIAASMGRLCDAIRRLDQPQLAGLRAMMPSAVQEALDAVVRAENDSTVGKALAVLVQAAQDLSDLQFTMLRPIAPKEIVAILGELRTILRSGA